LALYNGRKQKKLNLSMDTRQTLIETAWEGRDDLSHFPELPSILDNLLAELGQGHLRICTKQGGHWHVHEWLKKAILLSFRVRPNGLMGTPGHGPWFDKVPLKWEGWQGQDFQEAGFRAVPGAVVRAGAYIGPNVVLMPSFVNIGAFVDAGTMVDTWATIGSCAQIGKNCHISGGVGIGGVLEPLQATPVIIEDHCFIGARSEIAEGVIVEEGAVISMGVFIGASTKIVDRHTGEVLKGRVPAYSVVVPGTLPAAEAGKPALACAVIVKRVDAQTRSKVGINALLRDV
jgi:2,3,4,5-tetrahydropyridine-2-carboxylate N-succinyltransferase